MTDLREPGILRSFPGWRGYRMRLDRLKRREFVSLLGGAAAAWPLAARAQQPKMRRVGVLILGNADAQSFGAELHVGLRESGYFEGQNIEFVFRSADNDASSLPALAAELVALKVDVLVALYTPCALAAQKATREILDLKIPEALLVRANKLIE
jgi:putative tryptophan/tyrosine transport system substrate-binding protein